MRATSTPGRISSLHTAVYRPRGRPSAAASTVRKCAVPVWSTISIVRCCTTLCTSSAAGSRVSPCSCSSCGVASWGPRFSVGLAGRREAMRSGSAPSTSGRPGSTPCAVVPATPGSHGSTGGRGSASAWIAWARCRNAATSSSFAAFAPRSALSMNSFFSASPGVGGRSGEASHRLAHPSHSPW
jgi:hypothetical protein